jgi:hypothetical protein
MPQEVIEAAEIEWATALREFTGQQVIDGLTLLKRSGLQFAPDLPKFAEFCRTTKPAHPSHVERAPAIPHGTGIAGYVEHVLAPNAKTKTAQDELAKIRQILRRTGNPLCVDDPEGFDAMVNDHKRRYGF